MLADVLLNSYGAVDRLLFFGHKGVYVAGPKPVGGVPPVPQGLCRPRTATPKAESAEPQS
jgi:hypothetical protein